MSCSKPGTRTTTSGTRASSARSSASRIATTEKLAYDSPIVRSTRGAGRIGERRVGQRGQRVGQRAGLVDELRSRRGPSGSSRLSGSVLLSTSAPRWKPRSRSTAQKFSASYSGAASSVVTTANVVRRSCSSRSTACARSTNPSYIDWKLRKNSAMSSRNLLPEHAVGELVEGPAREVDHAHAALAADAVREREPAQQPAAEELRHAAGASRKSTAFRVGAACRRR